MTTLPIFSFPVRFSTALRSSVFRAPRELRSRSIEKQWLRCVVAVVDRELAPRLESLGDKKTAGEAARIAYRLDPDGAVERRSAAEKDRRVGLRPAPDSMARLSGLLPLVQGVAAYAALRQDADSKIAAGDSRGRGQIMADGQGYCQACNHTKQGPGWHTEVVPLPSGHTIDITTPTGHKYRSRAPHPPRADRWESPLEITVRKRLHAAA